MADSNGGATPTGNVQIALSRADALTFQIGLGRVLTNPTGTSPWVATNAPVASSRTDDIWFVNPEVGWLVNSSGQVCKTTDGGNTWTQQLFVPPNSPFRPYLRTIQFATPEVGWFGALLTNVSGDPQGYRQALLHHTVDGGNTWHAVENLPAGSPEGICGLAVVNENVMYGSGTNDPNNPHVGIIKTVDGGQHWSLIDMRHLATNLIDIHFFDEQRGFVVGGLNHASCPSFRPGYQGDPQYSQLKPVVLYTDDGGASWDNKVADLTEEFECGGWGWKLFWLNEQIGFVSIENFTVGAILKTVNGGQTWQQHPINDRRLLSGSLVSNANLEGIGFIDEQTGWVGGWGNANFIGTYNSFTQDGGAHWTAQDHRPDDPNSDVRVNINRYRFFRVDDQLIGYCSGKTVYKFVLRVSTPTDMALVASEARDTNGSAAYVYRGTVTTRETQRGKDDVRASLATAQLKVGCRPNEAQGAVEITYQIPRGTSTTFVGLWNHFGWHVRTLLNEQNPLAGTRTVIWDGLDEHGNPVPGDTHICRVVCDDICESALVKV
jgi:photosystem II stability/assembly factor-like uncharacterized protein